MRFLLKCIFWLGGVFLLMPGLTGKQSVSVPQTTAPSIARPHKQAASDNPTAARQDVIGQLLQTGKTLQEISSFCERNPALCMAGTAVAKQAGEQTLDKVLSGFGTTSQKHVQPQTETAQTNIQASGQAPLQLVKIPVPTPRPY